jgi:hypothetical protein
MKLYMQLEKRSKYTAGSASSPLLPLKVDIVVVTAPDERTGIERGQPFFCVRRENRQRIKSAETFARRRFTASDWAPRRDLFPCSRVDSYQSTPQGAQGPPRSP